ncbi:hypothetical protein, partial [Achromobacter spanius]|uniref:hypothetical protein n=1 Tax=Achromobacter spanius TaxID=217203 RepID=UPI003F68E360
RRTLPFNARNPSCSARHVAALQKNPALLDGFRAIYIGVLFLNLSRSTHPTVRRKASVAAPRSASFHASI